MPLTGFYPFWDPIIRKDQSLDAFLPIVPIFFTLRKLHVKEPKSLSTLTQESISEQTTMPDSALLGHVPISDEDIVIYKALLIISPSSINPEKKYPFGPPAPANSSHHSHGSAMIIGSSFAIALVLLITCSRLAVRKFRSRALGADDAFIIPAAIGCIVYLAMNIASESAGCLGHHLYDCTYVKVDRFVKVRND